MSGVIKQKIKQQISLAKIAAGKSKNFQNKILKRLEKLAIKNIMVGAGRRAQIAIIHR